MAKFEKGKTYLVKGEKTRIVVAGDKATIYGRGSAKTVSRTGIKSALK